MPSSVKSTFLTYQLIICSDMKVGERILCRHPFNESKRAYVVPQRVEELMKCFWPGKSGRIFGYLVLLREIIKFLANSLCLCPRV